MHMLQFQIIKIAHYNKLPQYKLNNNLRKRTFGSALPVRIQIRLHIRAVWFESLLGVFSIARDAESLHADNKISDQTARMWRLNMSPRWAQMPERAFSDVVAQLCSEEIVFRNIWRQLACYLVLSCLKPISKASKSLSTWRFDKHFTNWDTVVGRLMTNSHSITLNTFVLYYLI